MQHDVLIIGAGPAGLACALYFARFNRRALVITSGDSRAALIPRTWNLPGHDEGVPGLELLRRAREHAEEFGAEVCSGEVAEVNGKQGDFRVRLTDGQELSGRFLVFATGVHDIRPNIPNVEHYAGRGLRFCPVCDGYESNGKRLALIGKGDCVGRHALFLTTFTDKITILFNGECRWDEISPEIQTQLERDGIHGLDGRITEILGEGREIRGLRLEDGTLVEVDRAYSALEVEPRSHLAHAMGCNTNEDGFIKVDSHGRTNIPGVYAIGDVVNQDYAQIVIAMGQAATTAIHIQNTYLSEG